MNANEAEMVTGIIHIRGLISAMTDAPAITGRIMVAVDVLEVNSVKKVMPRQNVRISIQMGKT